MSISDRLISKVVLGGPDGFPIEDWRHLRIDRVITIPHVLVDAELPPLGATNSADGYGPVRFMVSDLGPASAMPASAVRHFVVEGDLDMALGLALNRASSWIAVLYEPIGDPSAWLPGGPARAAFKWIVATTPEYAWEAQ